MWGKDDEIRTQLKELGTALAEREVTVAEWQLLAATAGATAVSAVKEMVYKEEQILLPMCLQTLTEEEWAEIWAASPRYGWCLVEPREGYRPPDSKMPETVRLQATDTMCLPTGTLSLTQMTAIFSTMPVDLTFVDADDRVAFFSEGPDRVFARSKAVIGRKVQHCHPPRSVDVVERILSDFREGRQDVAEFWLTFMGRFVHVRYFAVRDEEKRYLGTLEVTQDVTKIRKLEGERRLLQYEEAK
jgi:PAS domain S-box-containing protein